MFTIFLKLPGAPATRRTRRRVPSPRRPNRRYRVSDNKVDKAVSLLRPSRLFGSTLYSAARTPGPSMPRLIPASHRLTARSSTRRQQQRQDREKRLHTQNHQQHQQQQHLKHTTLAMASPPPTATTTRTTSTTTTMSAQPDQGPLERQPIAALKASRASPHLATSPMYCTAVQPCSTQSREKSRTLKCPRMTRAHPARQHPPTPSMPPEEWYRGSAQYTLGGGGI